MGKESSRMESWPQHQNHDMQSSRKTKKKRWEDEINDFLRPEETEATKGSDRKNNDTRVWVAKQKDKWNEKEDEFAAAHNKKKEDTT